MRKITLPLILALGLLLPCAAAHTALAASVPSAADSIGKQIDKQMVQRYAAKTTDDGLSQSERETPAPSSWVPWPPTSTILMPAAPWHVR